MLGLVSLVVAILIFSSNSATYQQIREAQPQVFTACNVLCGQSLIGLAILMPFFWHHITPSEIKKRTCTEWLALCAGTTLYSVLGPFFNLTALSQLPVATVAILQQLEPVMLVLFAKVFFKEQVDRWSGMNTLLNVLGVVAAVTTAPLFGQPISFGMGSVYSVLSSICFVCSLLISNNYLKEVPMGLLVMFRALLGSFGYMMLNVAMNGGTTSGTVCAHLYRQMHTPKHAHIRAGMCSHITQTLDILQHVFSPIFTSGLSELAKPALWRYMWWYGLLYSGSGSVVLGPHLT
jgi:drug/metabolite transporter (DMT)-like permease